MSFDPKDFAGSHCGCRYQQDYRPTLGRDGKKESGTLEVIKFYYDGAIRFEQHCYGEAATFVFGVWADHMDPDGTLYIGYRWARSSWLEKNADSTLLRGIALRAGRNLQEKLFSLPADAPCAEAVDTADGSWKRTVSSKGAGGVTALCPVESRLYLGLAGSEKVRSANL